MAKTCSWCGKQIGFFDVGYEQVEIGNTEHWVCERCGWSIAEAENGNIPFSQIVTDKTSPALYDHYAKHEGGFEEAIQKQRTKAEAQQTNPLYEDIHQIAGDLRFIKNYLIFCIIVGIIIGLIWAVFLLQ